MASVAPEGVFHSEGMNRNRPILISLLILTWAIPGLGWAWTPSGLVAAHAGLLFPQGGNPQPSAASSSLPWEEPLLPGPIYSSRELIWRSSLIVTLKLDKAGDLLVDRVLFGTWDAKTAPPIPTGIVWQPSALRGIGFWRKSASGAELLPSGLRSQGPADSVEYANPKTPWRVVPGADWPTMLKNLQSDLEQILELKAAWTEVQAPRRIEKIQNWISRHENTLGGGIVEEQSGWGSLEQQALMEIIQHADLESAWKAVGLYARTNEGHLPPCGPVFATPKRRAFLMGIVQAPERLKGEKARALRLLGSKGMWKEEVSAQESKTFNELLIGGLKQSDTDLFEAARDSAATLAGVSPLALTDAVRTALKDLYQKQDPGPRKAALARALAASLGKDQWKAHSGNEAGMVVAFTQLAVHQDRIRWTIERLHGEAPPQKVTLVREKVDAEGKVVESASIPAAEMENPPWVSWGPMRGEWAIQPWSSGLWRVKAVGGDPKMPSWQSEARMVRVVKPLTGLLKGLGSGSVKVTIDPPVNK
jgi:hypothetical protein